MHLSVAALSIPAKPKPRENASHALRDRSNKRMDIVFLQGDISKRSRKEETMATMEKHGKSLTAEGRVATKTAEGQQSYEDFKDYHRSSVKALSAEKSKGPAETEGAEAAKSDAFEVVNEDGNDAAKSVARDDDKPSHEPLVSAEDAGTHAAETAPGKTGGGFHIVSLDTDTRPVDDREDEPSPPKHSYSDEDVYGTIESRRVAPIAQRDRSLSDEESRKIASSQQETETRRYSQSNDDFVPSSVVSVGQQDILPFLPGSEAERGMYDLPRLENEGSFDPRLAMSRSYSPFQRSPHWPMRRPRPRLRYGPWPGEPPQRRPFAPQSLLGSYQANEGYPRRAYEEFEADEGARRQLIGPSASSLPFARGETGSFVQLPVDGPRFPVAPVASPPMFQMQPFPQGVPQGPFAANEPAPVMMQASQQMVSPFVQQPGLGAALPRTRWADSQGYSRDEVPGYTPRVDLGGGRESEEEFEDQMGENESREEAEGDDRSEGEFSRVEPETDGDDEQRDYEERGGEEERGVGRGGEDERGDERGREDERGDDGRGGQDERDDGRGGEDERDDGRVREDEREEERDRYEPVRGEYKEEGATQRSRYPYENVENGDSDEDLPHDYGSYQRRPDAYYHSEEKEERDFPGDRGSFTDPAKELQAGLRPHHGAFPRYPDAPRVFHRNMYHRFAPARPRMEVLQMSAPQAHFQENKERRDPLEYFGPVSKNTIPGRFKSAKTGLENVLIKLNGKPLEDAAQLRSKIIDGKVVQGKGKVIKSKGPVNVKISHTNDAKHTKIIDIISPQNYTVYDTKSKIAKPAPSKIANQRAIG